MTPASKGATSFSSGFGTAAIGLGVLLGVVWVVLWGLEAAGGPDLRMPIRLLQSAGALVLIGAVLRWLLQARTGAASAKDER